MGKIISFLMFVILVLLMCLYIQVHQSSVNIEKSREAYIDNAFKYLDAKSYPDARSELREYMLTDKHSFKVLVDIGVTYMAQDEWQKAIPYFKIGLDLGSKDALKNLAFCDIKLGQFQDISELVPDLKTMAKNDPEVAQMLLAYACKINDKDLFVYAESATPDDFFRTRPQELQETITACDYFKLGDLKQKYLNLQKTITSK